MRTIHYVLGQIVICQDQLPTAPSISPTPCGAETATRLSPLRKRDGFLEFPQSGSRCFSLFGPSISTACCVAWLMAGMFSASDAANFYVATNGNDQWSGLLKAPNAARTDGPLASLQRARDLIRAQSQAGQRREPQTVYVRGGTYEIHQTLKLEARDGGSAAAPVTYQGYAKEKPVLVGGKAITGFIPYKGKILKADVGAQGFKGIHFRQLVFDGNRQHLARYPNFDPQNPYGGGWAYADGALAPIYVDTPGEDKRSFTIKHQDAREWARPGEAQVFVFARYNWWNDICAIRSVDPTTRRVTLAQDASFAIRPGDRYFFQNTFEELDAPGEWYLDRRDDTLYFWPLSPLEGKAVIAPTTRTILELSHASFLTIRGFTLKCSEGTAITLNRTTNCLIAANTICNVGDYSGSGVSVHGGVSNGVAGNDIFEIGSSGITLSGGDRKHLIPAANYADNNYIHHIGVFHKHGVGISIDGVGNRASHNAIHDGPRMGIVFSGNNLVIEYNHIRHMNLETEDTGAIYTGGRDWISSRGSVVRYNFIHDMLGYGRDEKGRWRSPFFSWGVYLDDNAGGVDVIGNIIVRCSRAGLHLHNGRDNHIENNLFIENGEQQFQYSGWTTSHRLWVENLQSMIRSYEMVVNEPVWKGMRNMDLHPTNAPLPNTQIMTGNKFVRNIVYYHSPRAKYFSGANVPCEHNVIDSNLVWHGGLPSLAETTATGKKNALHDWTSWQEQGLDRHSVVANPRFVDPARDDYRLDRRSPAFELGFKPIPIEKIGLYRDLLRASWPVIEAEGAREKPLVSSPTR